jgi:L-aspartate oxidase
MTRAAAAGPNDVGSMETLWRHPASEIFSGGPAAGMRGASGAGALWRRDADVVVVGSGAGGISVALTAAATGLRVLVVTKDLVGGATPLAQGGLAAALGAGDTAAAHADDTLVAGAGLCEPEVVTALAGSAPGAIGWLTGLGARLETRDLRLEGGHSARRIIHSGDDATGAEVHRTLLAALLASGIEILDRTVALDLIVTNGEMDGTGIGAGARVTDGAAAANAARAGALAGGPIPVRPGAALDADQPQARPGPTSGLVADDPAGGLVSGVERGAVPGDGRAVTGLLAGAIGADGRLTPGAISARAVVIAAGGLGQAFGATSNPAGATGDGIAIAARAGAVIRDLEFVQFHPTVLWLPDASGQCPLITEALRGTGAVLRDLDGTPLMAGRHPRGDLAPRDVVAARMAEVIAAGDAGHVWLDATALGRDLLENGFPTVTAACRKNGIDPVTAMIPVAPGAHYSCGGILADLEGRTSLPGLYAAGEAASTGVQGANRLASNSVTEAIIAGRRTGTAIADHRSRTDFAAAVANALSRVVAPTAHATVAPVTAALATSADAATTAAPGPGEPLNRAEVARSGDPGPVAGRHELARAISRYAGVMRDEAGLTELLRIIARAGTPAGSVTSADAARGTTAGTDRLEVEEHGTTDGTDRRELGERTTTDGSESLEVEERGAVTGAEGLELEAVEAANLRTVSLLIAAGALRRAESRGCHRRRDATETAAAPRHTLARWDGRELRVSQAAR